MEDRNQRPSEVSNLPTITLVVLIAFVISLLFISYKYIIDGPTSDINSLIQENTEAAGKKEADPEVKNEVADTKAKEEAEEKEDKLKEEAEKKKAEEKAAKEKEDKENTDAKPTEEVASKGGSMEITHTIKDGETFTAIAKRYGLSRSQMEALNPDLDPDNMGSGKKLNVKIRAKHTVGPGDILSVVAKKYGISKEELMAANKLTKDFAQRGDVLIIPLKK
jgi:LysM repeat protein